MNNQTTSDIVAAIVTIMICAICKFLIILTNKHYKKSITKFEEYKINELNRMMGEVDILKPGNQLLKMEESNLDAKKETK